MSIVEGLLDEVNIMLSTLWVPYKRVPTTKSLPDVFELKDLGVIIAGVEPSGYSYMLNHLASEYVGYRLIFVSTLDNLFFTKDEVIWDLARSGYFRYVRLHYKRQFDNIIQQGFGRKIINERLKTWNNKARFNYLIEENKKALEMSSPILLVEDPAFFDYMPEKEEVM